MPIGNLSDKEKRIINLFDFLYDRKDNPSFINELRRLDEGRTKKLLSLWYNSPDYIREPYRYQITQGPNKGQNIDLFEKIFNPSLDNSGKDTSNSDSYIDKRYLYNYIDNDFNDVNTGNNKSTENNEEQLMSKDSTEQIGNIFERMSKFRKGNEEILYNKLKNLNDGAQNKLSELWNGLSDKLKNKYGLIGKALLNAGIIEDDKSINVFEKIDKMYEGNKEMLYNKLKNLNDGAQNKLYELWNGLSDELKNKYDLIGKALSNDGVIEDNKFSDTIDTGIDQSMTKDSEEKIDNIFERMSKFRKGNEEALHNKLNNLSDGAKNKLSELWNGLSDNVKIKYDLIGRAFKNSGITIDKTKKEFPREFNKAINKGTEGVQYIFDKINKIHKGNIDKISNSFSNLSDGLKNKLSGLWNGLSDELKNKYDLIEKGLSNSGIIEEKKLGSKDEQLMSKAPKEQIDRLKESNKQPIKEDNDLNNIIDDIKNIKDDEKKDTNKDTNKSKGDTNKSKEVDKDRSNTYADAVEESKAEEMRRQAIAEGIRREKERREYVAPGPKNKGPIKEEVEEAKKRNDRTSFTKIGSSL